MLKLDYKKRLKILIFYILILIGTYVFSQLFLENFTDVSTLLVGYTCEVILTLGVIIFLNKNKVRVFSFKGLTLKRIGYSILVSILLFIFIYIISQFYSRYEDIILAYKAIPVPVIILGLLKVIISPVTEGVFYRYIIINISKKYRGLYVIISAILFGILSGELIINFVIATCFAIIYILSDSLELSILSNIIVNLLCYTLIF
ncbi:CPBP family intramembrane glutamic endopeptidase [Gemella cuniculi]|uniref:CPBP family intramembrane glutamic endopeptidase n=1 Tax=Gemella cuniculi TaxID=150240 RepID=UPI0004124BE5|nr:CPBP family intramembrane glutamic endopeptidase [Gemella cuniculi]